jgi:putative DNA-invertase from lambdoid prophage Rac
VQRERITARAVSEGWTIAEIVEDAAVSGGKPFADRLGGRRLLETLQSGDRLILPRIDRAFRSTVDCLSTVEMLMRRGVTVLTMDIGVITNGLGEFFLAVMGAAAQLERHQIRTRTAEVMAAKRERGEYLGGTAPFGYRLRDGGIEPDPKTHKWRERIRELHRANRSYRQIADDVREESSGRVRISHMTVRQIIAKPDPGAPKVM